MLRSVLHSPALAMISCCPPKQNATPIDSEIDNICRSNKFLKLRNFGVCGLTTLCVEIVVTFRRTTQWQLKMNGAEREIGTVK